jgi:hypothetical protein
MMASNARMGVKTMATWKDYLESAFVLDGDSWANVESSTLSESELNREFDSDYSSTEGAPFTVWTARRVYFPVQYDGAEWVASVARHPDGKPTNHVGG